MYRVSLLISLLMTSHLVLAVDETLKPTRTLRIVNGEKVNELNYPWMVELREKSGNEFSRSCGGSIIHPSWVLTAAHCVVDLETGGVNTTDNYEIRINNLVLSENKGKIIKVKRIVIPENPSFNPKTLDSDIALLELAEPVTQQATLTLLSKEAKPIPANTQAMLTGWGRLAENLHMYLQHIYQDDIRLQNISEPEMENNGTTDQLTQIISLLSVSGNISTKEILKAVLAAPQIGAKTAYDDVPSFLNKVIVENTPGFITLTTALQLDPNSTTFEQLAQIIIDNNIPLINIVYTIDEAYDYSQGQLQKLYYPIVPQKLCSASNESEDASGKMASPEKTLCAGFPQGGKSDCSGDSGGPLTIWNGTTGNWIQVGLVSFSSLCARQGGYDFYTRVSSYQNFIQKYVPEAQFITPDYHDMSQCDTTVTPVPFAPKFALTQQKDRAKAYWEASSYTQEYILTFAPYSNPISELTLNNIQTISLGLETQLNTTLPVGSDFYVAVQAKNCAGFSEYSPIQHLKVP